MHALKVNNPKRYNRTGQQKGLNGQPVKMCVNKINKTGDASLHVQSFYHYYYYYKILYSWCIYIAFYTNSYKLFTILQKKGDTIYVE